MARKIPAIVFVLVLLVATLNPGLELKMPTQMLDAVQPANAQAPQNVEDDGTGDGYAVKYTPVPTPKPTPVVTPKPTPTPVPTPEPTPMVKGMSGPEVKELQGQLLTLGFMTGEPDGIYGKGTEDAVSLLQGYLNEVEKSKPSPTPEPAVQTLGYDAGAALADDVTPAPTKKPDPYPVNGIVNGKLMDALKAGDFPLYREVGLMKGSTGSEAKRLQSRLNSLAYIYKNVDGAFGANTEEGLKYFQKVNGLPETGIADQNTLNALYSPLAKLSDKPLHPYMAVVDVSAQRVYIYAWHDGKYDKRIKQFKCSTGKRGTPTPLGTFADGTGPGNRWHYFKDFNCWAQYAFYINGDILFHSVLYSRKDTRTLTSSSLYNLGTRASHGCVRLAVKDAKWIWTNMNAGSTVIVRK